MKSLDELQNKIRETKKDALIKTIRHHFTYPDNNDDGICDCGLRNPVSNFAKYSVCKFKTKKERDALRIKAKELEKLLHILENLNANQRETVMSFINL